MSQTVRGTHDAREEAAAPVIAWLRERVSADAHLVLDSRSVRPGDVFVALKGAQVDGRAFVGDAVAAGAAAVLREAAHGLPIPGADRAPVPCLDVKGLAQLAGHVASGWYGHPSRRLDVIAVTGTNGKTSCTQWIARGLARMGKRSAVIGTLGAAMIEPADGAGHAAPSAVRDFGLTTPDAPALQRMLFEFAQAGVEVVAVEVSSIGLEQGRLNGTEISTALFTSFSRDHLDFHGDERAYLAAKLRLFGWPGLRTAIVNGDDAAAPMVLDASGSQVQTIAVGRQPGEFGWSARRRLQATQVIERPQAMTVSVGGDFGIGQFDSRLLGHFNVVNALAVGATWLSKGVPFDEVLRQLALIEPAPGRMQRIERPGAPLVVVDYAHSPDAIAKVLQALRPVASARGGELWCLFGAGGDRDSGKRPMMGAAAEANADRLVITSDNPRSETPFRIVSDIRAGLTREPWLTELDRAQAIGSAVAAALPTDVILVAGKGHEAYQEIAGVRHPFSDAEVVQAALLRRVAGEGARA